jgi:hypothetical protein
MANGKWQKSKPTAYRGFTRMNADLRGIPRHLEACARWWSNLAAGPKNIREDPRKSVVEIALPFDIRHR